jgi:hypothetical protein
MWLVKGGDEKCPNNQMALRRGGESVSAALCLGQELVELFPPPLFHIFSFFCPCGQESEFSDCWMKVVHWWFLGEEMKPSFTQSVSVFTVKIRWVFCYFNGFRDDMGSVGPVNDCKICSIEVDALFCLF